MKDIKVTKVDDTTSKVVMTTKKAKRAMLKASGNERDQLSDDQIVNNNQLSRILTWGMSWDLTMDSEVTITIPRQDCRQ